MRIIKMVRSPYASLVLNFVYAIGNCIIGFFTHSWWFITIGAYYTVLAITRFSVLQVRRKADGNYDAEFFARKITGILLVVRNGKSEIFCFSREKDTTKHILGGCKCFGFFNATIYACVFSGDGSGGDSIIKYSNGNNGMDCCTVSRNQSYRRKKDRYG